MGRESRLNVNAQARKAKTLGPKAKPESFAARHDRLVGRLSPAKIMAEVMGIAIGKERPEKFAAKFNESPKPPEPAPEVLIEKVPDGVK